MRTNNGLSRWTLRADGLFLILAGSAAMISETVGHFFGKGPLAALQGSPYTIGSFEAHGLAIIIGILLSYAGGLAERRLWHKVGLGTHILLGGSNLLFWSSFVQQSLVPVGVVTTALHIVFVVAQFVCLRRTGS